METILIVLMKIVHIVLLFCAGFVAKGFKMMGEEGEEAVSNLLIDIFWPCLIIFSITAKLERADILINISLPLLALLNGFSGYFLGLLFSRAMNLSGNPKRVFLYHAGVCNFTFMVLPLVIFFLPEKGAGLLFISNLGGNLFMLTFGIAVLSGKTNLREMSRGMLSPALVATIGSIIIVLLGLNKFIPRLVFDVLETLGSPTVPLALTIAGARIYKLGFRALKFDRWNINLGVLRLVLVPVVLMPVAFALKYFGAPREVIIIFMLINVMPVSVQSVSLAMKYNSSPDLAAEGVVFTHLFSVATITAFIIFMKLFLF